MNSQKRYLSEETRFIIRKTLRLFFSAIGAVILGALIFSVQNFEVFTRWISQVLPFLGLTAVAVALLALAVIVCVFLEKRAVLTNLDSEEPSNYSDIEQFKDAFRYRRDALGFMRKKLNEEIALLDTQRERNRELQVSIEEKRRELQACQHAHDLENELYAVLNERMPSMVWLADAAGNLLAYNPAVKMLTQGVKHPLETVDAFIEMTPAQYEALLKRNFETLLLSLNPQILKTRIKGKTRRIFRDHKVERILFLANGPNSDAFISKSYLKTGKELFFINEISKIINEQTEFAAPLQTAVEKIVFLGRFASCSIRLIEGDKALSLVASSGYSDTFVYEQDVPISKTHMGLACIENKIITLNRPSELIIDEPSLLKIMDKGYHFCYIPLSNYNKTLGVLSVLSDSEIDSEMVILLESLSVSLIIALEKILLYDTLKNNYFKTVEAFVTATEIKNKYIEGHSRRVAEMCRAIAQRLYLNDFEADDLYITGLLHDVGKLTYADNEPFDSLKSRHHGVIGRAIMEKVGLKTEILEGIEGHHDPYLFPGESASRQPFYAQIVRISNDFDTYKNSGIFQGDQDILEQMKKDSGTRYAPQLMFILSEIVSKAFQGGEVTNEAPLL